MERFVLCAICRFCPSLSFNQPETIYFQFRHFHLKSQSVFLFFSPCSPTSKVTPPFGRCPCRRKTQTLQHSSALTPDCTCPAGQTRHSAASLPHHHTSPQDRHISLLPHHAVPPGQTHLPAASLPPQHTGPIGQPRPETGERHRHPPAQPAAPVQLVQQQGDRRR